VLCPRAVLSIHSGITAYCRYVVMTVWHTFLNLHLLGQVWEPAADYNSCSVPFNFKKVRQNGYYYLRRAATPDQITQENSSLKEKQ
jgi:hypothetical protein